MVQVRWWWSTVVVAGCGGIFSDPGGGDCAEESTAVAVDAVGPLGASAEQVAEEAGSTQVLLSWTTGGNTGFRLEVGAATDAWEVVTTPLREQVDASDCPDRLELEAPMTAVTDDGMLDEATTGTLVLTEDAGVTGGFSLEDAELRGALSVGEGASLVLDADWGTLDLAGSSGTVSRREGDVSEDLASF